MPRITPEEKKAKLREKLAAIEHQLQQADAQVKIAQKRQEIRKQILAGKVALIHMHRYPDDPWSKELAKLLELTIQGKDRLLFGLEYGMNPGVQGATDATGSEMVHSPPVR